MKKYKILLTNDDGIDAVGIKNLEKVLLEYGDVYVYAPIEQQSAKSCSISCFLGNAVTKIDDHHFGVSGTPVDCVEVGLSLLTNVDIVVSGCNSGFNISSDILYSGTCGAATQGLLGNTKSIAFSIGYSANKDNILTLAKLAMDYIIEHDLLSDQYYLNVNLPEADYKDIMITKLQTDLKESYYVGQIEDNKYHIYRKRINQNTDDISYDYNAVMNGYISITPIGLLAFDNNSYKKIKK